MKLLHRLFASAAANTPLEDNEDHSKKGATRASALYSVTFETHREGGWRSQIIGSGARQRKQEDTTKVGFFARAGDHCLPLEAGWHDIDLAKGEAKKSISGEEAGDGVSSQHKLVEATRDWNFDESEDDWILVETTTQRQLETVNRARSRPAPTVAESPPPPPPKPGHTNNQMALDKTDIDLIKASWAPVREDMAPSGLLLFKELFTKFPQYKDFFPQFDDLDLERMQEHKRLQKHALKVIETVTFVVDSIGDENKANVLSEALTNLVKSHLMRRVGLVEFRNLGIVLIDFICDINRREAKLDTNLLVTAWTKLYSIILDLVRQEAEEE